MTAQIIANNIASTLTEYQPMAAPRQLKDTIRNIATDVVQQHAVATIEEIEEIVAVLADEIEALAADRVADLRAQPECESDQPQLFPELEELPQAAGDNAYDSERDTWDGANEAFTVDS
jgi:hypothetical protein